MSEPDSPRTTLWQRIIGLGRQRTGSAVVEAGTPPPVANPPWTLWDESWLWFKNLKTVSADGTAHHAQSGTERGVDLEEGDTESTQAGHGEGSQTGEHLPPFTSSAFAVLPTPLPVEDIFFDKWFLSAIRVVIGSIVTYISLAWIFEWYLFSLVIVTFLVRGVLVKAGYKTVFGIPVPTKKRLLWALVTWVQKSWEHFAARLLLRSEKHKALTWTWWFFYLLISDNTEFKQNYLEAWRQRQTQSIRISISDEILEVPIPQALDDEVLLKRLRMYYRMIGVGQGISGLLLPKHLERIDCVEIIDSYILGRRTDTLQLGRYNGRLVSLFRSPEFGKGSQKIAKKIHGLSKDTALEFKQTYNLGIISLVLATPPLGSAIFAAVWIKIFVHKPGVDLQALVQSAFTTASYIVTTGALIIAFVAFLDQKRTQNDEMIDRFSRGDSLGQRRARNDTTHDEASPESTASAPQAKPVENQPATDSPNP